MERYLDFIQKTKLFSGVSKKDIKTVLACLSATKKEYKKGEYIYSIGDNITNISLLLEGKILIGQIDYWGNNSILTEILEGEMFGETYAAIGNMPSAVNVIAMKDAVVLSLNVKQILTTCNSACDFHAKLIQNFVLIIASRNKILTEKIKHISHRTTRDKLLSYLSQQSLKTGSSEFNIPFNRQELADYLAVDRSAMSSELSKLRDSGIITFNKNHFIISKNII